jgi:hypothetical protein
MVRVGRVLGPDRSQRSTRDWLKPARQLVDRCGSGLAARPVWLFNLPAPRCLS